LFFVKRISLCFIGFSIAALSGARGMDLSTLTERSPFAPPGAGKAAQEEAAPAQLEFRGIATDESGTIFSVFDLSQNRGYWVRQGEAGAVTVKNFNPDEGQIEVEQGGRALVLKLKRSVTATAAVAPVAAPSVGTNANPGAQPQRSASAQSDASRLEAVAAEVRRRRALRNAATQGGATQTPPPPAPAATP
jgi:hypothetical protein